MRRRLLSLALAVIFSLVTAPLAAQEPPAADTASRLTDALRVFLDCQTHGCDRDFFITELAFVNWTRDRTDADIHLLVTGLETGAGGTQYTVQFVGQRRFANRADTLVISIPPNSTSDERRRELARLFKIGLVRHAASTSAAAHLRVVYDAPKTAAAAGTVKDPWNFWVFRMSGNGFFNGESQAEFSNLHGSLSATRTTERWKANVNANIGYSQSEFELDSVTRSVFIQRSSGATARVVKSIGEHWSAGFTANVGHSEYQNQDLSAGVRAAIEYNYFPWKEATQRQFVAIYSAGPTYYRYIEETIYLKTTETLPQHQFIVANETKARWGSVDVSARFSQYLHDPSKSNISIGGEVSLRVTRGLNLDIYGSASRVGDQLYLAAGELSEEDILRQQRALRTSFRYFMGIGLSYTFGSIYNTIVNPRLDKISGGFFF